MFNDKQISYHVKDTSVIECMRYPVSISDVHLASSSQVFMKNIKRSPIPQTQSERK